MLSGVVFDMDGVLIDSHAAHKTAWRTLLGELGREVSEGDLAFVLDGRRRDDILRHFLGEISEREILEYGKRKDEQFFRLVGLVTVKEGLFQFLDELERHEIAKAVATSATSFRADEMLKRFKLTSRFAATVTGSDVARGKPDPAIFRLAGIRLKLDPATLMVVEDAASGVKAAKAAGMKCLGIAIGDRVEMLLNAGADAVVPDFSGMTVARLHELMTFDS